MAEFLIDTNVFSRIFTGDKNVKHFVEILDAAVDTVVYVECLQGSKSNHEKRIVEGYLIRFELLQLSSQYFGDHNRPQLKPIRTLTVSC